VLDGDQARTNAFASTKGDKSAMRTFAKLLWALITHAGCIAAGVDRAFSRVCLFVCLSDCPRCKRKNAWTINTKLCTHILYSSRSAWGQKVKGQDHTVTKTVTVARLLVTRASAAVYCSCRRTWGCMSILLPMFSSFLYVRLCDHVLWVLCAWTLWCVGQI